MSISVRAGGQNTSDGEPIADEADIEELESELSKTKRRAWFWRGASGVITVISLLWNFVL